MATCKYCGGETAPKEGLHHLKCADEYLRRRYSGICVACGKTDSPDHEELCVECTPESPFLGYRKAL